MSGTPETPPPGGALLVAVAAFAAYAFACAPAAYLLDSAELAAASFGLGIAHPPGEALALLWGRAFAFLPLGNVAFRVGLSQAAAAAAAAALVYRITWRVGGGLGARDPERALVSAAAALAFALAPGVVGVAVRPEVYALAAALALGALSLALAGEPRLLLVAVLMVGLGLANHPLVAGLAAAGVIVGAVPVLRSPGAGRLCAWSVLAFAAGALVIAYVPVRAAAAFGDAVSLDVIVWGDARTPAGLLWLLSARTFAAKAGVVHAAARPLELPFVLIEELEWAFALLAVAGGYFLLRRARPAAAALLVTAAGSIGAALYGGFDPANPDVRGYLAVAIAVLAALAGGALAVLMGAFRVRALRPAVAAVVVAGALTRWPASDRPPGLRQAWAAAALAEDRLSDLPPRAALLTSHYETAFLVSHARTVEGRRPDVAWGHLGFARSPGYAERVQRTDPLLAGLLRQPDLATAQAADRRRPVRFEADERLAPTLAAVLSPQGQSWGLERDPPSAGRLADTAFREAEADRQVRAYLGWWLYQDARLACRRDLEAFARDRLAALRRLLPEDQRAQALAASCAAAP